MWKGVQSMENWVDIVLSDENHGNIEFAIVEYERDEGKGWKECHDQWPRDSLDSVMDSQAFSHSLYFVSCTNNLLLEQALPAIQLDKFDVVENFT